jgi:CRP/FNR family transcriptional regulator, cyclic AMP receptor protein
LPLHSRHSSGALRSSSFFEGWTDDELEHFERIVDRVKFDAGEVLIREGQPGQAFLILISGEAEVSQRGESLRRLHAGDHAGEMALLDRSSASATVVARSPLEALVLDQRDFDNLLETVPSLGRRILATLARWFRDTPRSDS